MSAHSGPNIVEDGLVLCLDAANKKSFRGEPCINLAEVDGWNNNFTSWSGTFWQTQTRTQYFDEDAPYPDVKVAKTIVDGTGAAGISYNDINLPTGTTVGVKYYYSAWFKSATRTQRIYAHDRLGANSTNYQNNILLETIGEWQRWGGVFTSTSSGQMRLHLAFNGGSIGDIVYFTAPQIEQNDHATPFVIDSRGTTVSTGGGWADLSGNNNHGELVNSPIFSTTGNGSIQFDGTSFIDIPSVNLSTSNFTVIGASRYFGPTRGRIITSKVNNWLMGHWSNRHSVFYSEGWVAGSAGPAGDEIWRIYTGTGNISADQYSFWVNLSKNINNSTAGAQGPNGFSIGRWRGTSEGSTSQVGFVLAYNRVLSDEEIRQTVNALKSRYGI